MMEKGSAFLLKVGDGAASANFGTVAGLRTKRLSINGEAVVVTNKVSGGWRQLLGGAGVRHVSVSGAGVFTGSAAEARLKGEKLPTTTIIPSVLITRENAKEFYFPDSPF